MAKWAVVAIGVDRAGNLPCLNAASGAESFAAWAEAEGYESYLFTDEEGPLPVDDIKVRIREIVREQTYCRLVVFFSGHGIYRGPNTEMWLLSRAHEDGDEAINVADSMVYARMSDIEHVVFVSDACRVLPDSVQLAHVRGSTIFPNRESENDVAFDTLSSCRIGKPSYEATIEDAASYCGVFTKCLLAGLRTQDDEIAEPFKDGKLYVTAASLKQYLTREVPKLAANVSVALKQRPEIRPESHEPLYLVEVRRSGAKGQIPQVSDELNAFEVVAHMPPLVFGGISTEFQDVELRETAKQFYQAHGRGKFETESGFTIIGSRVLRATASKSGRVDPPFYENGAWHVRVYPLPPERNTHETVVLEYDSGYLCLGVYPGYIGTVLIDDGRVANLSYAPSMNRSGYDATLEQMVSEARAWAAAASSAGTFLPKPGTERRSADFLRWYKAFDPTLGILAAYAYLQVGHFMEVRSVYDYMCDDLPAARPFDMLLLASKAGKKDVDFSRASPFCPMLTQGWAYLGERRAELLAAPLLQAEAHLLPGLWTSFDSEGGELIWNAVENGSI